MHTQRAGWSPTQRARATAGDAGAPPEIEFVAEAERCDGCSRSLAVLKSRRRRVVTLESGTFVAKEVLKHCSGDESHPVMGSRALSRLVKLGQRYGYDVVVHVGIARYLRAKQRTEIQAELLADATTRTGDHDEGSGHGDLLALIPSDQGGQDHQRHYERRKDPALVLEHNLRPGL